MRTDLVAFVKGLPFVIVIRSNEEGVLAGRFGLTVLVASRWP